MDMKREHHEQKGLPEHLRDDAPFQVCSECARTTWVREQFEMACRMPQPDGTRCTGHFRSADPITKARVATPRSLESYHRSVSVSAEELGLPPRASAAISADRLVSEERIAELVNDALSAGMSSGGRQHFVTEAIRQAVREAGEAAAKVCDECRVLICETEPVAVAKETATDIASQIRKRLP